MSGESRQGLEAALLDPFERAVHRVFDRMLHSEVQAVERGTEPEFVFSTIGFSALIGFASASRGVAMISMAAEDARRLVSAFVGEPVDELDDLADGVGELLNIVVGHATAVLAKREGVSTQLGLPTTVYGERCEICRPKTSSWSFVRFASDIDVELTFRLALETEIAAPKILIADDSRVMRRILIRALEQIDPSMDILEAADESETLEILERLDYGVRLLVLDVNLPDGNGLSVLEKLRASKSSKAREIPVIFVTSDHDIDAKLDALRERLGDVAGEVAVLLKPFQKDALAAAVSALAGLGQGPASE